MRMECRQIREVGEKPMQPKDKHIRARVCATVAFWFLLCCPGPSFSQPEGAPPRALRVGVAVSPPLYMKNPEGQWEGVGVELWRFVARHLDVPFEFREFGTLEKLLEALEKGAIDVIPSLPVREQLESTMDFSQSYFKSGLAIAVPAEGGEHRWVRVFESFLSPHVLKAIAALALFSLAAGTIVWLFERRRNSEMFGDGIVEGIGHGIWWAMVTMTTVGYGDKAPKTWGGRAVALVWMIFSVIFIASFTAQITTSRTVSELRGKVRGFNDLHRARVGSIPRSEGFDFLGRQGIAVIPFETVEQGLAGVADKRIDAFVLNEQVLKYRVKREFAGRLQVLPGTFDEYFVSIALQQQSPLRKPVNKALLNFMKTQSWTEMLSRYMP